MKKEKAKSAFFRCYVPIHLWWKQNVLLLVFRRTGICCPRYLAWATWNAIKEGAMPFYQKSSAQTEIFTTLVSRLKKGLKFVVKQNQDSCMPNVYVVVLLGYRLDWSRLKNYETVQCRVLLYTTSVNYGGAMSPAPSIYGLVFTQLSYFPQVAEFHSVVTPTTPPY